MTTRPASFGGRGVTSTTSVQAAARPTVAGIDAQIVQRPGVDRLLLGGQDALHRRVAGLAGLVGHADHRRQRRLDRVARDVAVAADRHLAVGHRQTWRRGWRPASPAARRPWPGAPPSPRRSRPSRRSPGRARPCGWRPPAPRWWPAHPSRAASSSMTWIPAPTPICSERLIAAAASSGPTVSATTSTSSPSSAICRACSTRVLVQFGQQPVGGLAIDRAVVGEGPIAGRVGHVLDQDDDLHRSRFRWSGGAILLTVTTVRSGG